MKNNFIKSENFTKWAIRKVSVGVVSAAIASGIFIVVGSGEAHASDLQDKAPVVQNVENKQVDDATESKVIENKVNTVGKETKQVEKSTVEAKNVVSAEKQSEVKSEKEVSIESKETDVNNLIKKAKDVAESQTTPVEVKKAVMENTKDTIDVPAKYLDKANFPGPFTAGVNQVIPYEFFGGDGMLTRLILKSSDKAPWSDNGSAKNPALLPLEKLGKGLYFYEVDLEGTKGKSDKELLDLLKANGTQSYKATIKVYGEKDGKADLTNVVATKEVTINLHKETKQMDMKPGEDMLPENMTMDSHMNKDITQDNMTMNTHMSNGMMKKGMLPKTSAAPEGTMSSTNSSNTGILGLIIASFLGLLGFRRKNN
ncbi:SSURE domain-containing protein [Gemella morbillorum]